MSHLAVKNLRVKYGNIVALDDVSIDVGKGEIVAVIGPNGAGKSTLLLAIAGVVRPKRVISGWMTPILGMQPETLVASGIALVPEGRRIFGSLSVAENIELGATVRQDRSGIAADTERVLAMFPGAARTLSPARQQAFGRRAANAGDRARHDVAAETAAPRRAFAWACAAHRIAGLCRDRGTALARRHRADRRAERQARAGCRRPHLCVEFRHDRDVRQIERTFRLRCFRCGLFRLFARGSRHDRPPERHRRDQPWRRLCAGRARDRPDLQRHAADQLRAWRTDHGRRLHALCAGGTASSRGDHRGAHGNHVLALGMERIAFRPLRNANPATLLIASFAVSFLIQHIVLMMFGSRAMGVGFLSELGASIEFAGLRVPRLQIVTILVTGLTLLGLVFFFRLSRIGMQMRAAAEDFTMARLVGVKANRVIAFAFAISGVLACMVSFYLVAQTGSVSYKMGVTMVLIAFVASVIGGMGSLAGAALGGFLIGIVSVSLQAYLPVDLRPYRDAFVFLLFVAFLLWRPQGLLC